MHNPLRRPTMAHPATTETLTEDERSILACALLAYRADCLSNAKTVKRLTTSLRDAAQDYWYSRADRCQALFDAIVPEDERHVKVVLRW